MHVDELLFRDWSIFADFDTKLSEYFKKPQYNHDKFQGVYHALMYTAIISKDTLDEIIDLIHTFQALSYADLKDVVYVVVSSFFKDEVMIYHIPENPDNSSVIYKAAEEITTALYKRKWFKPEESVIPFIKENYMSDINFSDVSDDEFFARRDYMEAVSEFINNIKNEKYKKKCIKVLNEEYRARQVDSIYLEDVKLNPFGSIINSITDYCESDYAVELNRNFIKEIYSVLSDKKSHRAEQFEFIAENFPQAYINFQYSRIVMNILEDYIGRADIEKFKSIMNEIQPNSQIQINSPCEKEEVVIYILKVIGVLMLISKGLYNQKERKFLETYNLEDVIMVSTSVAQKYAAKGYLINHKTQEEK